MIHNNKLDQDMKIDIKISRIANKYYFIKTVAGVNLPFFSIYLPAYEKITGPLSKTEKNSLNNFVKIFNDIGESKQKELMRASFSVLGESEIFSKFPFIEDVFQSLDDKFEIIWQIAEPKLTNSAGLINKNFVKNKSKIDQALKILSTFFGHGRPGSVEIQLIYSPVDKMGGRYIDDKKVSINLPGFDTSQANRFSLLFFHEMIHAHFEGPDYKNWLRQFTTGRENEIPLALKMGAKNLLREAIAACFASSGVLTYIFNDRAEQDIAAKIKSYIAEGKDRGTDFDYQRLKVSILIRPTILKYLAENKKIDGNFLEATWQALKNKNPLTLN